MQQVYLSGITSVLGQPRPVSDLTSSGHSPTPCQDDGVTHYRERSGPIWRSAAHVGARNLAETGATPDLVIYASQNETDSTRALAELGAHLDLPHAETIHTAGHECGNLAPALQVARDALVSGRSERVLLLLADHALKGQRLMTSGLSVFSDGAAACTVTLDPPAQRHLRLLDVVTVRSSPIDAAAGAGGNIVLTTRLAAAAMSAVEVATGLARTEFEHLMFSNYRAASQRFLTYPTYRSRPDRCAEVAPARQVPSPAGHPRQFRRAPPNPGSRGRPSPSAQKTPHPSSGRCTTISAYRACCSIHGMPWGE